MCWAQFNQCNFFIGPVKTATVFLGYIYRARKPGKFRFGLKRATAVYRLSMYLNGIYPLGTYMYKERIYKEGFLFKD